MKRKDGVACMPSFSSLVERALYNAFLVMMKRKDGVACMPSISSLVDESSVQCMLGDDEEEGWCSLHAQYFLRIV